MFSIYLRNFDMLIIFLVALFVYTVRSIAGNTRDLL